MQKIAALVFEGFEILDLFGPLQMFGMLPDKFEVILVAQDTGPVRSNGQISAHADARYDDVTDADILFVPGGRGVRREVGNAHLLAWLRKASANADLTLSVCTGSNLLATAGLLDGCSATTNKAGFKSVTEPHTKVSWQEKARWVEDGKFFTSSGVSAGIDMSLAAIAKLHGIDVARDVALWAEYTWQDDPTQDPFAAAYGLG